MVPPDQHGATRECQEVKLLLLPILLADPGVSAEEHAAFEAHLATCPACQAEFEDARQLVAVLRQHADLARQDRQETPPQAVPPVVAQGDQPKDAGGWQPMTAAEGWEDLKRRSPSLAEACRHQQRSQWQQGWFGRIGTLAAAAGILIAIGIGWWLSQGTGTRQSKPTLSSVEAPPIGAFAELVTPQGRTPLALNRPVVTEDQPQEILLGGMHRAVMNHHTEATFTASPGSGGDGDAQGEKTPYEIQLACGELYVEVVPGHPFLVNTANARLEITGTKFDVRVEGNRTELVLLKGSVRLSQADSPVESVDVTAGCISTIVGQSRPSAPRQTDAATATAWARNLALSNALALAHPAADPRLLDSIRDSWPQPCPTNLDSINYPKWREQHRDWFAREFPWVFKVQEVLKERHGIDADYVELLMVSGDIWQFNYPRPWDRPIAVFNAASLREVANHYGVEPDRLSEAVATVGTEPLDQTVEQTAGSYQACLRLWQADIAATGGSPEGNHQDLLMFTLRAGTYLTNTRTAAWAWSRAYPEKAAALLKIWRQRGIAFPHSDLLPAYPQWMGRLEQDVTAADHIKQAAQEVIMAPQASACGMRTALSTELAEAAAWLRLEAPR